MNPKIASCHVSKTSLLWLAISSTVITCFNNFFADIIYEVCAVTSLFNFSCPFAIASLTCCEFTKAEITHFFISPVVCQHANYQRRKDFD